MPCATPFTTSATLPTIPPMGPATLATAPASASHEWFLMALTAAITPLATMQMGCHGPGMMAPTFTTTFAMLPSFDQKLGFLHELLSNLPSSPTLMVVLYEPILNWCSPGA